MTTGLGSAMIGVEGRWGLFFTGQTGQKCYKGGRLVGATTSDARRRSKRGLFKGRAGAMEFVDGDSVSGPPDDAVPPSGPSAPDSVGSGGDATPPQSPPKEAETSPKSPPPSKPVSEPTPSPKVTYVPKEKPRKPSVVVASVSVLRRRG